MAVGRTNSAPPVRTMRSEAEQIERLLARLQQIHPVDPATVQVVKAPLRICPLGAHIDHQLGLVTGMTIDQPVLLAFAPTSDGSVHVDSINFDGAVSFALDDVPPYRARDWGNYVRGAVLALQQEHQLERGLVGVIGSDMPIGGLSSSAAVTIAYLLALETLNDLAVSQAENIAFVRYTENEYIGLNNGILDQSVILGSKKSHLTYIDCQEFQIDTVPMPAQVDDFEILVVYSGVTHVLMGTDYNSRVAECQEAAQLLLTHGGQASVPDPRLRHVDPGLFDVYGHRLPVPLQKRASHYFGEMHRVEEGIAAWHSGDLDHFGALMTESGDSSIEYYECGSPQLITLHQTLRGLPGVYGARFSGAGFRGNFIALIDPAARAHVTEAIHRRYPPAHPEQAEAYSIHFCRPDGQAGLISRSA